MAEDKKDNIGGIPNMYWRYIAALAITAVDIFTWNSFFTKIEKQKDSLIRTVVRNSDK